MQGTIQSIETLTTFSGRGCVHVCIAISGGVVHYYTAFPLLELGVPFPKRGYLESSDLQHLVGRSVTFGHQWKIRLDRWVLEIDGFQLLPAAAVTWNEKEQRRVSDCGPNPDAHEPHCGVRR